MEKNMSCLKIGLTKTSAKIKIIMIIIIMGLTKTSAKIKITIIIIIMGLTKTSAGFPEGLLV
jgi:hypothetical protein